jgi:hypothetical protein
MQPKGPKQEITTDGVERHDEETYHKHVSMVPHVAKIIYDEVKKLEAESSLVVP